MVHLFVDADQLLQMRDEPIDLHGIAEAIGRLIPPAVECGFERHPIKAGVDLDGVEILRITLEPALLRKAFRIEEPAPVLVDPAGAADVDLGNS